MIFVSKQTHEKITAYLAKQYTPIEINQKEYFLSVTLSNEKYMCYVNDCQTGEIAMMTNLELAPAKEEFESLIDEIQKEINKDKIKQVDDKKFFQALKMIMAS